MTLDLFLKYLNSLQTSQDDSEIYVKGSVCSLMIKFLDLASGRPFCLLVRIITNVQKISAQSISPMMTQNA